LPYIEKCPRCRQMAAPNGAFLFAIIPASLKIKWFIRIAVIVELRYCPMCGYIKINLSRD